MNLVRLTPRKGYWSIAARKRRGSEIMKMQSKVKILCLIFSVCFVISLASAGMALADDPSNIPTGGTGDTMPGPYEGYIPTPTTIDEITKLFNTDTDGDGIVDAMEEVEPINPIPRIVPSDWFDPIPKPPTPEDIKAIEEIWEMMKTPDYG